MEGIESTNTQARFESMLHVHPYACAYQLGKGMCIQTQIDHLRHAPQIHTSPALAPALAQTLTNLALLHFGHEGSCECPEYGATRTSCIQGG